MPASCGSPSPRSAFFCIVVDLLLGDSVLMLFGASAFWPWRAFAFFGKARDAVIEYDSCAARSGALEAQRRMKRRNFGELWRCSSEELLGAVKGRTIRALETSLEARRILLRATRAHRAAPRKMQPSNSLLARLVVCFLSLQPALVVGLEARRSLARCIFLAASDLADSSNATDDGAS